MSSILQIALLVLTPGFAAAQGTHQGTLFIIAMPRMTSQPDPSQGDPSILLLMATPHPDVWVNMTTGWVTDRSHSLLDTVQLTPFDVSQYTLNSSYSHHVNAGFTFSFELAGTNNFSLTVVLLDNVSSIASFLALPVGRWGKVYFAVTLGEYCASEYCASEYCTSEYCASEYCASEYWASEYCASEYCASEYSASEYCASEYCDNEYYDN
ncbi:hypothetical protein Btru_017612 [Bulinus truncatus]|nr:hypothetical protein Btru_017612 [Bulinus truncatus]